MNNLAPMKNCPGGVQGNLNWMPGYKATSSLKEYFHAFGNEQNAYICGIYILGSFQWRHLLVLVCVNLILWKEIYILERIGLYFEGLREKLN